MGWTGHLRLNYSHSGGRTTALDRHHGPLRVLQRLYPEGPGICHHVLVHPPGGIVGGDVLKLDIDLAEGSHAVLTTPGATRFYRSAGAWAEQTVQARLAAGSRLEWLPLETIVHGRCLARNRLIFTLAPEAQMMGADVLALGLPAAGDHFAQGQIHQRLELPGRWLEAARIDGGDRLLRESAVGLAGHGVLGTLWMADGAPMGRVAREALLDAARAVIDAPSAAASVTGAPNEPGSGSATRPAAEAHHRYDPAQLERLTAGVTALDDGLLVLRVLGHRVEPVMRLVHAVWAAWRPLHWGLTASVPRIWSM